MERPFSVAEQMRFAEVFLRLGSALVAWMVIYAHFLWLAVLFRVGCGPDGDEMYKLLLGLAPITIGVSFALRATRPFAEIHSMLRWFAVPLVLLLPFIGRIIWQAIDATVINEAAFCSGEPPPLWQLAWAPAQIVTVAIVLILAFRVWRSVAADAAEKP